MRSRPLTLLMVLVIILVAVYLARRAAAASTAANAKPMGETSLGYESNLGTLPGNVAPPPYSGENDNRTVYVGPRLSEPPAYRPVPFHPQVPQPQLVPFPQNPGLFIP